MIAMAIAAAAISAVAIGALCAGDPKRRRAQRVMGRAHSTATRRFLAAAAAMPGLYLAMTGHPAAFLVWLGACSVAGWFAALAFRRRPSNAAYPQ